ncbi:MAG: DUF951 domain-containing protein [Veillonellaceae bacterium]|nr:DUF951 domain-containing protein [Veillonellaceae bacterium]MDD6849695.1 DUF951 domain-containing protein [Veillonellaceae bacterium]MDY4485155.1 DUF951 domain-containing protein [Anaerovibrio sp.]
MIFMVLKFNVGDQVKMRKSHPCGSYIWQVTRVGADIGMKCQGCGHFVMLPRVKFERMVKSIVTSAQS